MAVILAVLLLPLLGAGLTAVLAPRWRGGATVAILGLTLAAAVGLARSVVVEGPSEYRLGGSGHSLGLFAADGLGSAMVLLSATVALLVTVFAILQSRELPTPLPSYWPLTLTLLTGLHGLFLAGDLLMAYLMLELVAVAGASMVAWGGGRRLLAAGARYFYAEMTASIIFLAGVGLVWTAAGTTAIAQLSDRLGDEPTALFGLALMTVGLLLKIPVVPLHFWLPAAHALAPSAVSPLLSALVVKSSFVVLLRLWGVGTTEVSTHVFAQLLGGLGAAAVIWGGLIALRAHRVKRVLAYSTIAQLGLLLVAVPMVLTGAPDAWKGGVFHAIAHALPKAGLLLAVALLAVSLGGDTVDHLEGAATRRPLAAFALGIAAVSLIGLPPTGGFVAKWYLVVASISTGQWWWAAVIVVGSLLTAAYLARLVQRCFSSAGADRHLDAGADRAPTGGVGGVITAPAAHLVVTSASRERVRGVDLVALGLATSSLLLGLYPTWLLDLLEVGAPVAVMADG
jgi:multicomponent Na+:H+ antiporter subunit D